MVCSESIPYETTELFFRPKGIEYGVLGEYKNKNKQLDNL